MPSEYKRLAEAERLLDDWRHEVRAMLRLTDTFLRPRPGAACETPASVSPGPRPPEETITVFFHSHADTGEHLGCNLDIIGMHTNHAVDLLLAEIEDQQSPLNDDIEELRRVNWPEWAEKAVRFVISWDDGYSVERYEVIGTPPASVGSEGSGRLPGIEVMAPDPAAASGDARPSDVAVSADDAPEPTVISPGNPDEYGCIYDAAAAARNAARRDLTEKTSAGDDFDLESAKALAFVEAPDSPSKEETSRLAEQLLAACDALDAQERYAANTHALNEQLLDARDREIDRLRNASEQLLGEIGAIKRAEHAEHVAKVCADERDDLQQQLDEMQRNGIPDERSSKIARERDEHAKRNSELEQNEVDRMRHVTDLIRQRDKLKESCATWKEGYISRRQERDDLQRQLDRAITIREEARDLQVQAEGDLDAANAKVVGAAAFIREHELGNEYWCWHHAAEALAKGETRKRAEMLQTKTPLCEEDHCRPSVETSEERDDAE